MEKWAIYAPVSGIYQVPEMRAETSQTSVRLDFTVTTERSTDNIMAPIGEAILRSVDKTTHQLTLGCSQSNTDINYQVITQHTALCVAQELMLGQMVTYQTQCFSFENLSSYLAFNFTIITKDMNQVVELEWIPTSTSYYRQGEIIGYIILQPAITNRQPMANQLLKKPQKYDELAANILRLVGVDNFQRVTNCMTRVRLQVKNPEQVSTVDLKTLPKVQGVVWNGNELQIVVGSEAFKVRDCILKQLPSTDDVQFNFKAGPKLAAKNHASLWQRFLAACNGVVVPILPMLISVGVISGIASLLGSLHVINMNIPKNGYVTDLTPVSGFFYIISNTGLALLGIFFCYSVTNYMGGNQCMGILIGLSLASSYFLREAGVAGQWHLFYIGSVDITVKSYGNNILPHIFAAMIYCYADRWIKKWMPGYVDIIFRPLLGYIIALLPIMFIFGPFLVLLEGAVSFASKWFYSLKFGIGGFIIGFIWQPIVFLGLGWPISMAFNAEFYAGVGPLRGSPIFNAAALAMIGVILAMMLRTRNRQDKGALGGALPSLVFGVTEPAMYGFLAPKGSVFWISCVGAGISGWLIALFDVAEKNMGGYGILTTLGFDSGVKIGLYLLFSVVGLLVNFVITYFVYKDKKSEATLTKQANRILYQTYIHRSPQKVLYKHWKYSSYTHVLNWLIKCHKQSFANYEHAKLWINNHQLELDKAQARMQKLQQYNKTNRYRQLQLARLERKYAKYQLIVTQQMTILNRVRDRYQSEVQKLLVLVAQELNDQSVLCVADYYHNAISSTSIFVGEGKAVQPKFKKADIFQTQNRWKLLFKSL